MKSLKNYVKDYIKSYINESVWDIEDNVKNDNKGLILDEIKKFMDENYTFETNPSSGSYLHTEDSVNAVIKDFKFVPKNGKYVIDVTSEIYITTNPDIESLTNEVFEWGDLSKVNFTIESSTNLKSLKGLPKSIDTLRFVDCNITSLSDLSREVKQLNSIVINHCTKLTSLMGMPNTVTEVYLRDVTKLADLKGISNAVNRFECENCTKLSSLKGLPGKMEDIYIEKCPSMTSLKGAPEDVSGMFMCAKCNIKNLVGSPRTAAQIRIESCPELTSLKGAPDKVNIFYCRLNRKLKETKEDVTTKYKTINMCDNFKGKRK